MFVNGEGFDWGTAEDGLAALLTVAQSGLLARTSRAERSVIDTRRLLIRRRSDVTIVLII